MKHTPFLIFVCERFLFIFNYKKFKPLHVEIFVLQVSEFQPFWCPSSFEQKRFPSSLPQTLVNFPTHQKFLCMWSRSFYSWPPPLNLAKEFRILAKSVNVHYKIILSKKYKKLFIDFNNWLHDIIFPAKIFYLFAVIKTSL